MKNLYAILVLVMVFVACSEEDSYDMDISTNDQPSNGYMKFYGLSGHTQDFIKGLGASNTTSNTNGRIASQNGTIVLDSALAVFNEQDSSQSFSFAVINQNTSEKVSIDNLVVHEKEGTQNAYIFRYTPDTEWLISFLKAKTSFAFYSGEIQVYSFLDMELIN